MHVHMIGTGSILSDRISACAVVDGKVIIDTPNGAMKALRRFHGDPSAIDVCLITHFHADHYFDIVFLLLEAGLRQQRARPLHLVAPRGLEERVDALFNLSYPESWQRVRSNARVEFHELPDNGARLTIDEFKISAVAVQHTTPVAFGYMIDVGDARLGYTGDTERCPAVDMIVGGSSKAIIDVSFLKPRSGHMGITDAEDLALRFPDVPLIATHMSQDVRQRDWPFLTVPDDGDSFEV